MDLQLEVNGLRKRLDAAEQALAEMTTLRDVALRDFVTATDKWERAEVQVIDLKAALRKAEARIEKLRAMVIDARDKLQGALPVTAYWKERAREAIEMDDAASK